MTVLISFGSFSCFASLAEGTYILKNRFTNKVIVSPGQDAFGLVQTDISNTLNQKWKVTESGVDSAGNTLYSIQSETSRKVLDGFYDANSPAPQHKVIQFANFGNDNQKWRLIDKGTGEQGQYFNIVNGLTNTAIEVFAANSDDGAAISQWELNGHPVQDWEFIPVIADGTYKIKNRLINKYLEVSGGQKSNGVNIVLNSETNNYEQIWAVKQLASGQYQISSVHSDKVVQVKDGRKRNNTEIVQWSRENLPEQSWLLDVKAQGETGFLSLIVNGKTGKAADVNQESVDGTTSFAVVQKKLNDNLSQDWEFIPHNLFSEISLHDPSIMQDSQTGKYWIFGSFLAAASSDDLVNWQSETDGINANNTLFGSQQVMQQQLEAGFQWSGANNVQWAADVFELDNQYYFYFNQGVIASPTNPSPIGQKWGPWGYIGVASSSNLAGEYRVIENENEIHAIDKLAFVKSSGGAEELNTDPVDPTYDASIHPNAVDPDVFRDKDGKLWMIYGSYSGGIFMYELDESGAFGVKGKPIPALFSSINSQNNGFGQYILGGEHARIEAAFMMYSPVSDYYYVFTSFGGLTSDGGYNIRVVRSRNPQGPYEDANSTQMYYTDTLGQTVRTIKGSDSQIAPYAVKLMGSHRFVNDAQTVEYQLGYMSPGHNSAYYDAETNKHFLVFHTRFPGMFEAHQVRVHEMFINSNGWPVVSPLRYIPLESEQAVSASALVGDYQFINHQKDINNFAHVSQNISLTADGLVTGDVSGFWSMLGNEFILQIDGVNYHGVVQSQWHSVKNKMVLTFTALSDQGISVWGVNKE